ncbi:MAG: TrkH family potassium uptake protein [Thermodesulfobacteriota bacterium]
MRWKITLRLVGIVVCLVGIAQLLPAVVSWYYRDNMLTAFLGSMLLTLVPGIILLLVFRYRNGPSINHKQGIVLVVLACLSACFFGGLPFVFSGVFPHLTDCFFESVSGFTTTGASIVKDVESLPPSILFWRSLTQWLGGMGIILLSLAVLPFLGVGGMQLYSTEVPGHTSDRLRPRIRDTAKFLWVTYLLLTAAEVILLLPGGMGIFDALCHAFSTVSSGGFSTKNASIGEFSSLYIEMVIMIFMYLAAINFALHFRFFRSKVWGYVHNSEFRFFTCTILIVCVIVSLSTWGGAFDSYFQALRHSLFQTVSTLTTSGFVTSDYGLWGALPLLLFLLCMLCGGMAGSTSGGLKFMRLLLLGKLAGRELKMLVHPRAVFHVKMDQKRISDDILKGVCGFVLLYLGLILVFTIALSIMELDILTALGAVVACAGNVGPGPGSGGLTSTYAGFSLSGKWLLTLCMFLGRLEIYTVIILLFPAFWKQ